MEKQGCGIFDRHTELNREELHVVKYGQREYSRQRVGHARGKHRDQQTGGWTSGYLKEINGEKSLKGSLEQKEGSPMLIKVGILQYYGELPRASEAENINLPSATLSGILATTYKVSSLKTGHGS